MMRGLVAVGLLLAIACSDDGDDSALRALPANGCREDADCVGGATCVRPGTETVCGGAGCPDDECSADIDCATNGLGDICTPIQGVRLCRDGCSDDNPCAEHQTCSDMLRCEPRACTSDAACGTNFSCSANQCRRTLCSDDAPCDGYCVRGECQADAGTCELPAA